MSTGKEDKDGNSIFYVFTPTGALIDVAKAANQEYLTEVAVWIDKSNDRSGRDHSQEEVVSGFWALFLANLIEDDPETESLRNMRNTCLSLGFSNCWNVVFTKVGGETPELLSESIRAKSFLHERGLITK